MQIVNGYVCFTTCDASTARKGHDPRNPTDDPQKAAALDPAKAVGTRDAVQFGGILTGRVDIATTLAQPRLLDFTA